MVFNTALSGIKAASSSLDVLGHNIANAATVGFKSSRAEFQDVYSLGAFGGNQTSIGSGVRLSRVQQNFGQGNPIPTGNPLDLSIKGAGFFILSDQGTHVYSRAGDFTPDKNGFIENSSKQRLTGYLADSSGNLSNTLGDLSIDTSNISPMASTLLNIGVNLAAGAKAPSQNWVGGATPSEDTYNNKTSATIYDSLGNSHIVSMFFIKADSAAVDGDPNAAAPAGTENQWYVAVQIDNKDVPDITQTNNTDNLFRINFNKDGSFEGAYDVTNTPLANNQFPLSIDFNNGSNVLNFGMELAKSTQFGSPFAAQSIKADGFSTGTLGGLFVGSDGILFGNYSNGQSRIMGQVLLADFPNNGGLQSLGGTSWGETSDSGQPIINTAGAGTLGLISSGALEDSNVDLTNELVGLIGAQRSFQANAQTIKTADAITQTIINIR